MSAYTDPPSRHQADQILEELRGLHRSFNDLKSNLGFAGFLVLMVGAYALLFAFLSAVVGNRG